MQSSPLAAVTIRRYANDQLVNLAKLVIEAALQPIVEVGSGHVFGYESLMRGYDRLGFADPITLIDETEATGQLLGLEQLLLGRAVAKFSALPEPRAKILFVNLATPLVDAADQVIERMLDLLQRARIEPTSVCFELSERGDHFRHPGFMAFTERLATHGFKLAIDDFGVGHGEMRLISDVAIDYIKIDRHFIAEIDTSARKRHLVRNIVRLAHVLGIRVIAEGVETESQFGVCRDVGCDLVQGWLIAHPTVNIDELPSVCPHIQSIGTVRSQAGGGDELLIRREIEQLPTLIETESAEAAFRLFSQYPLQSYFPVVDAQGMPRGIIHEQKLKSYIYQPYGRDLLRNTAFQHRVGDFLTRTPFASVGADAEELLDVFTGSSGSDCLILTENLLYAGILSATSLLRIINEKQLKSAQDQNPLTALPGNRSIAGFVEAAIVDGDTHRYLCYCDFDQFKPFNDRYGFQQGDNAITLFADLMRRFFVGGDVFLGHIGGDDFFIGITGRKRSLVEAVFTVMLGEFRRQVAFFYEPADREAGFIEGADRSGDVRHFPLMRCSVCVLELPSGVMQTDGRKVGETIARLKSAAKKSDNGLVFGTTEHPGP